MGTPAPDAADIVPSPAPDITAVMGTPAPEPAEVSVPDPSPAAEARRRIGIREAGRLKSHNAKPKPKVSEMVQNLNVLWMSARSCDAAIPNKQLAAFIKFVASFLGRRFTAALNDVATRRQAIADAYEALIDTWLADDTLRQDWKRPSDEGGDDEGPAKKRCRKGCGKRP
jgi:hypothetical protein